MITALPFLSKADILSTLHNEIAESGHFVRFQTDSNPRKTGVDKTITRKTGNCFENQKFESEQSFLDGPRQ